jgi:hypothetical protein
MPVFLDLATRFKNNVAGIDISTHAFGSSSADAGKLASVLTKGIAVPNS